jgi:hypothetical protein
MNTYNITFVTNSEQASPYTKAIEADNAKEAKAELRNEAQIPARFILSCKKA